jgi:hypothetical protein
MFNSPNPSSRTVALGSIQPLRQWSTTNLPGVRRECNQLKRLFLLGYFRFSAPEVAATCLLMYDLNVRFDRQNRYRSPTTLVEYPALKLPIETSSPQLSLVKMDPPLLKTNFCLSAVRNRM